MVSGSIRIRIFFFCAWVGLAGWLICQQAEPGKIEYNQNEFDLYPKAYDRLPEIPSPLTTKAGKEVLLALLKNNQYALIPVTVENELLCSTAKRSRAGSAKINSFRSIPAISRPWPEPGFMRRRSWRERI